MQSRKERRDRVRQANAIHSLICAALGRHMSANYIFKLDMLIQRNCQLLGDISPTFLRFGTMYAIGELNRRYKTVCNVPYGQLNKELHPDLWTEFSEIEQEHQANQMYLKDASAYIATILIKVPTVQDVFALVPPTFTQEVSKEYGELFNNGNPMETRERMEFKEQHRKGNEALIKLQLLEMIRS